MQSQRNRTAKRDTSWKKDGRAKGVYWRKLATGSKAWSYYADGKRHSAASRQEAIDGKAKAGLRKSAGLPAPDTRVLIRDLAEEVRETKRRRLRGSSFEAFERSLDKIILPELGHLRVTEVGADRIARLVRDLEGRGLQPASIRRYLSPLGPIFKLAVRRGVVHTSPVALLSDEERPTGGGVKDHYVWSAEEISKLIASAAELGKRADARYDYSPLIHLLALTGLRVSEALALRWTDVNLLAAELQVRGSWSRSGELTAPKTAAGFRTMPLSPGLVDLLIGLKPEDATDDDFVFASKANRRRPISYFNFRRRGFELALKRAGLADRGITIHGLRSAAASILIRQGLSPVEVAEVLGHADANITLRVYAKLFDRSDVAARVRKAQGALDLRS